MENASKALLMVGGILIAILLIALLTFAWTKYSDYQKNNLELKNIENVAKFNEQFTNYDRDNVQGYELLTLIYQVVDYNERRSSDTQYGNDEKYNPITLTINMKDVSPTDYGKLSYNGSPILIEKKIYEETDLTKINAGKRPSFKKDIEDKIKKEITLTFGGEEEAKLVAKNIGSIFLTNSDIQNKANSQYNRGHNKSKNRNGYIV